MKMIFAVMLLLMLSSCAFKEDTFKEETVKEDIFKEDTFKEDVLSMPVSESDYAESENPRKPFVYTLTPSTEMENIVELAKKFSYESDFIGERFTTISNTLLKEYEGGQNLSYVEFLECLGQYDDYGDDYETTLFYIKKADINNDGTDEIVTGRFDGGSMYHSYTDVYTKGEDGHYDLYMTIYDTSSHKVVEYEENFYLIEPSLVVDGDKRHELDIWYVKADGAVEAVIVSNGELIDSYPCEYRIFDK